MRAHKRLAMELVEEYTTRLISGEKPDPREYLARYTGPDKDNFMSELNMTRDVATLLTETKILLQDETAKGLTDVEREKRWQEFCLKNSKLFKKHYKE